MKLVSLILLLGVVANTVHAENVPLNCKDYVSLTETAVQQRDQKIPKVKSLVYLGGDEFMSNRDKKIVRQMIERVYANPKDGVGSLVAQARNECSRKWKN